uniref:Uncharacterized protein n=1 Tax=Timema douglasi TaxID=61478 RepID=A0A7R8VI85_TIMDO|nr:unnamed protein product [Timema douglasi]
MDIMVKQMYWLVALLLVISITTAQSKSSKEAYCQISPKHTMCLYDDGPAEKCKTPFSRGFSQTEKNAIVNEHNRLRNIVALGKESRGNPGPQPSAANMRKINFVKRDYPSLFANHTV